MLQIFSDEPYSGSFGRVRDIGHPGHLESGGLPTRQCAADQQSGFQQFAERAGQSGCHSVARTDFAGVMCTRLRRTEPRPLSIEAVTVDRTCWAASIRDLNGRFATSHLKITTKSWHISSNGGGKRQTYGGDEAADLYTR